MLHVLNGDATRVVLEASGVPGERIVWADVLHEGPVPPDHDVAAWLRVRAGFHAEGGWVTHARALERLERAQAALEDAARHDTVVLWFEHDLYDQLLLIRHLSWWRRTRAAARLELICIDAFPGVPDFAGLGQLRPAQLASLMDVRRVVSEAQLALAETAWSAFTSPDPRAFAALLDADTTALPFLAQAVRRMLDEFPAPRSGLSRTERQILHALAHEPLPPADLFRANQAAEQNIFMGDTTFWLHVLRLGNASQPLLQLVMPNPSPAGAREESAADSVFRTAAGAVAEVRITETGRDVLAGQADHVHLNGVDRWIGGTHLHAGAVWRWDAGATLLIPPGAPR